MNHVIARITTIFKTFDPTILPIAILLFPFSAATTDVTSSGSDVPTATTVNHIILSERPTYCANAIAPSTTRFHPTTRRSIPKKIYVAIFRFGMFVGS